VVYTNPSNGLTNVPIDLTVKIPIGEPIQAKAISGIVLSVGGATLTRTPSFTNTYFATGQ
jgi:hypothetical protein